MAGQRGVGVTASWGTGSVEETITRAHGRGVPLDDAYDPHVQFRAVSGSEEYRNGVLGANRGT